MVKNFYFLCGLPRAGNTLFASIINQNPDVAVTANSPTAEIYYRVGMLINSEFLKGFPDFKSLENVIKNILPNYYSDWKQSHIIDRQLWGEINVLNLLKLHIKNELKIIIMVRNVEEVLASFIKLSRLTADNFINHETFTVEEQCNKLMDKNGMIMKQLQSISNLLSIENKKYTHLIEYNDLVKNPKKEIDAVYDFLNIPKFEHKYKNMEQLEINGIKYDDSVFGVDLHKIRTNSIKKADYNVEDILPKHIIEKSKALNIWKQ